MTSDGSQWKAENRGKTQRDHSNHLSGPPFLQNSLPDAGGKSRKDRTRLVSQALKIQTFFQRIKTSATKSPRDVPNKQGKMDFFLGSGRYHLNIICHGKDYNSFLQKQFRIALKEFHALLTAVFFFLIQSIKKQTLEFFSLFF